MRSVSAKIVIWFVGSLVISLFALTVIGQIVVGSTLVQGLEQFNDFQFRQARHAYESGGAPALSQYLRQLNSSVQAEYHLIDKSGRDVRTGEDQSQRIRTDQRRWHMRNATEVVFGNWSDDGRYGWVGVAKPQFSMAIFAPFYLLVLATVGALYWLVTSRIARPLRRLAGVVDRFGRGELDARALPGSKDEIGNLGHSFNAMADRLQTLLTAERQLLQDVSHELRSPLARLTFEAEMVRRTNDRDASAARLRHEIERLSELVGALIDMARVEGDPAAVDMEDVCVNDLLDTIAADCALEASARDCRISLAPTDLVHVRGNSELLHRAFENVVRNAIRHSPAKAAVEVDLHRTGESAVIRVRDHGPGIPDALVTRIFDPFFRVDPSRDSTTGGLGLGLSIARRAIRAHHGDITAENAHPGALLRITIPLKSQS